MEAVAGGAELGELGVVCDDDEGFALCVCEAHEQVVNVARGLFVEVAGGFIG